MNDSVEHSSVRADKWLWAARFFRTRNLAAAAIKKGNVSCNGSRISKPSRLFRCGDALDIQRGDDRLEINILRLSDERGAAKVAQTLYSETQASQARRQARADMRRAERQSAPRPPAHRPDKHARQRIRRLLGK